MAVTFDLATESIRTGTTSPQTFSHPAAASGVKGVVLAIVHGTSSTDHVTAASYGGVALTRIQRNVDTANEPGAAELWFLGAGVPQGTQTVSYTPGATTNDIHAVAITLLGAADLEVVTQGGINNNVASPAVTLDYAGRTCMAFGAFYGGGAAPTSFTENPGYTRVHDHDLGAFYSVVFRETTASTSEAFPAGGSAATDDVALAVIAVSEVQGATIVEADGAAAGAATVTSAAAAIWNGVTAAAGLAASAVVGAAIWLAVATAPGVAAGDAPSATVLSAIASSDGTSTALAEGADGAVGGSNGLATGTATATGIGAALVGSDASAAGVATALAEGADGAVVVEPPEVGGGGRATKRTKRAIAWERAWREYQEALTRAAAAVEAVEVAVQRAEAAPERVSAPPVIERTIRTAERAVEAAERAANRVQSTVDQRAAIEQRAQDAQREVRALANEIARLRSEFEELALLMIILAEDV